MNYTYLKEGDILPSVGVLQKLLNKANAKLVVDGIFGPKTKSAVKEFQRSHKIGIDGIVGKITWPYLTNYAYNLSIMDCVDVFDPSLYNLEVNDIRRVGGNPLIIGGMSNGVEQAVTSIVSTAPNNGVFLLRFHGHGSPGSAGISNGKGDIQGEHLSSIHSGNLMQIINVLQKLTSIFGPYGCIQFMHCETGQGIGGRQMLITIANHLRVPVTAACRIQYGGGLSTFQFEGPTYTAFPGGISLKSWSENLPEA